MERKVFYEKATNIYTIFRYKFFFKKTTAYLKKDYRYDKITVYAMIEGESDVRAWL